MPFSSSNQFDPKQVEQQLQKLFPGFVVRSVDVATDRAFQSLAALVNTAETVVTIELVRYVTLPAQLPATSYAFPSSGYPKIEPKPLEDLGTSIEPIVGWREWIPEYTTEGLRIYSRNDACWFPYQPLQALHADDPLADHDAPKEGCECGIYAWDNQLAIRNNVLHGEVYLWGKTLICERGYRAEYAYPKKFYIQDNGSKLRQKVATQLVETYGVPVELV